MLLVYLEYFLVFFYSLITSACRIIDVYRYRVTLVNHLPRFCTLIKSSFVYLFEFGTKFAVRQHIHIFSLFSLASTASLNFEINITFDGSGLVPLNVKGIRNFKKQEQCLIGAGNVLADIIFLQETHSTIETYTQWKNEWGAQIITCRGSSNARGASILINKEKNQVQKIIPLQEAISIAL